MLDLPSDLPPDIQVTAEDLANTPEPVLRLLAWLIEELAKCRKRLDELETRIGMNSSNSSKPPSSDPPLRKRKPEPGQRKRPGGKPGHPGHRQAMIEPTHVQALLPGPCRCGNAAFPTVAPIYTHQLIELPEIKPDVTHLVLYAGRCPQCGKMNKAHIPPEQHAGFGPRFSAVVAEMVGAQADSRRMVQTFCASVFGVSLSLGAIQKIVDRVSAATAPHYEAIGVVTRQAQVNHADEISWRRNGELKWLWVLANKDTAFFRIDDHRNREAFNALIGEWQGILVSDGYGLYRKWPGQRQTCLAHLIRAAQGLAEVKNTEIASCGGWAKKELQRLCHMATVPPTVGQWNAFYARLRRFIALYRERKGKAGTFAKRLEREKDSLWVFLQEAGVSPTNNHAERMIRFPVQWRKSSLGTASEKGERWVERILTLRQTCRIQGQRMFPVLVDAVKSLFHGSTPDFSWLPGPHRATL